MKLNKAETIKIFAVLQSNYPDSFRNRTDEELNGTISLWQRIFVDDSYTDVSAAVLAHIASDTNRFMPPVGVIKNMLVKIKEPATMTEMEAWALVAEATRHSAYRYQEEFEKLPPVIQKVIGNPNVLREWALMDAKEVGTVIQSNFMRSYSAKVKNEKELAALPSTVKDYMAQISGGKDFTKALAAARTETEE